MYSVMRNAPVRREIVKQARTLLTSQALSLLPALVITHLFFHWKSFLLEFGGFVLVWFAIDFVLTTIVDLWRKAAGTSSS